MNYYTPNFYQNYPYGNSNQYMAQVSQVPNPQSPQQSVYASPSQQYMPQQGLYGKMVDGIDVVKGTEVPIGGFGIFPKADFSELYVKTWNENGTTKIMTLKPEIEQPQEQKPSTDSIIQTFLDRISVLENKIDTIISKTPVVQQNTQTTNSHKERIDF